MDQRRFRSHFLPRINVSHVQSVFDNCKYLVRLVAEEVDLIKMLILNVAQAVRLVPSVRENVEGNLATNSVCERIIRESFLQGLDEGCADTRFLCN